MTLMTIIFLKTVPKCVHENSRNFVYTNIDKFPLRVDVVT